MSQSETIRPPPAPKSLQVFTCRSTVPLPVSVLDDSYSVKGASPQPSTTLSDLDVPIASQKCKRSCTDHPIFNFISYDHLNPLFLHFDLSLSFVSIPRSYEEALLVSTWKHAMDEEMDALVSRETRDLVSTLKGAVFVGCHWVYTLNLKYCPDGPVDHGSKTQSSRRRVG